MNPATPASAGITAASPQTPTALAPAATAVPTFDTAGTLDAIRNYYQIPSNTFQAGAEAQGMAVRGQQQNEANRIGAENARQNAIESKNASAYRLQPNPNGGASKIYNVYTGKQVNALEFAQLTGASPSDVFKNSQNDNDKQFAKDYDNYQTFMQALMASKAGDKQAQVTYQDYIKNNPGLQNLTGEQVRQLFASQYGELLGSGSNGDWMGGSTATPGVNHFAPANVLPAVENLYRTAYYGQGAAALGGASGNPYGVDLKSLGL